MFVVTELRDIVRIEPRDLGMSAAEYVELQLNRNYAGKVIPHIGLALFVEHVHSMSDTHIAHGEPFGYVRVSFSCVVFRPQVGEVIEGLISAQSRELGLVITVGFFHDIQVPPAHLPSGARFDDADGVWVWEQRGAALYYDLMARVRVRVLSHRFRDLDTCPTPSSDTWAERRAIIEGIAERRRAARAQERAASGESAATEEESSDDFDPKLTDEYRLKISPFLVVASAATPLLGPIDWAWAEDVA